MGVASDWDASSAPGFSTVSAGAVATVSVASGCGAPNIHTASAHSTMPEARSWIPESRVMASSLVGRLECRLS